jgi:hypothetical protein
VVVRLHASKESSMSDFFEYSDDQTDDRAMRRAFEKWQRRPSIVDWLLVAALVGVGGLAALLTWAARS